MNSKKPIFGPFSPFLGQKLFFSPEFCLCHACTTPHGPLTPYLVSERRKLPRKLLDRRVKGQTDLNS